MAKPTHSITHPAFKYVPAAKTDITQTWRRFGWTPIEEVQPPRRKIVIVTRAKAP